MNKKKGIIIGVFALIITMVIGYALFGKNIEIKGTATASGNLDLSYTCTAVDAYGNTTDLGTCEVVNNKITTTSTLTKPTDMVAYTIEITNDGTIPAVLKTIDSSNNVSIDDPNVPGDGAYLDKETLLTAAYQVHNDACGTPAWCGGDARTEAAQITLQSKETLDLTIMHTWADSADLADSGIVQPALPEGGATMNYDITLGFVQTTN